MSKLNIPTDVYAALMVEAINNRRSPTMQLITILMERFNIRSTLSVQEATTLAEYKAPQPTTPSPWKNKYEGLTGEALMDAMDADARKDYGEIASG